jgi:hypothetical protein
MAHEYIRAVQRYLRRGPLRRWVHPDEVGAEEALLDIAAKVKKIDLKLSHQLVKASHDSFSWQAVSQTQARGYGPDFACVVGEVGSGDVNTCMARLSKRIVKRQRKIIELQDKRRYYMVLGAARNMASFMVPQGCVVLNTYPSVASGGLFAQALEVQWGNGVLSDVEKLKIIGTSANCLLVNCRFLKLCDANGVLAAESPYMARKIKFRHIL